jgi:hypothetical protein
LELPESRISKSITAAASGPAGAAKARLKLSTGGQPFFMVRPGGGYSHPVLDHDGEPGSVGGVAAIAGFIRRVVDA